MIILAVTILATCDYSGSCEYGCDCSRYVSVLDTVTRVAVTMVAVTIIGWL